MSLVPSFEFADDGRWYEEALLGEYGLWHICFDDQDPPELIIRANHGGHETVDPTDLLATRGLPFTVRPGKGRRATREFPTRDPEVWEQHDAVTYFLEIHGPIPTAWILQHDGVHGKRPRRDGVFYGFAE